MTTISLHKYHDQINQLLEDSQFALASNHCRYILQQYPRHIDTYRLLAKILIEQRDYSGATELFQRVLSADPNDYIAHAGLSVVYREEDVLSQAIWHLERAYEIEPYNSAIQQELRTLYIDYAEQKSRHQRGDVKPEIPDKLPLTKGALARLYIQGELYGQAIDVLHEALAEDEDRIDLEVLLTEALWRDNQRVAAVQVCLQVLEKLPNCITVNAVLAEIWLQTGRIDEAQQYLHDLQALILLDITHQDIETPAGSAFQAEGAMALPALFEVARMGDSMDSLVADEVVEAASEDDTAAMATDEDAYQWLEGLEDEFSVDDQAVSSEDGAAQVTDSDWLRQQLENIDETEETAVSEDVADWLDEEADADAGALAAGAVAAGAIGAHLLDDTDAEEDSAVAADAAEDDMLDWLSQEDFAEDRPLPEETAVVQAEAAEEIPDWLADMTGNDLEAVQMNPLEASDYMANEEAVAHEPEVDDAAADMYSWLDDIAADESDAELEAGGLDLTQFAEFGEEEELTAADDEEIVWRLTDELNPVDAESIREEQDGERDDSAFESAAAETGDLEEVPDWLRGSSGTDELDAVSPAEIAGNEISDELAGWVGATQSETAENDGFPDWLAAETDVSESADEPTAAPDEEDDFFTDDLPSWMVDSSATVEESAPLTTDETAAEESAPLADADLPAWLLGDTMVMDDSGLLLDPDDLPEETTDSETTQSAISEELPGWLTEDAIEFTEEEAETDPSVELSNWLSADDEEEDDDDDDDAKTAVVGGLLGAAAAGLVAKELLDDEDEDETQPEPEPLTIESRLENEVMEDAVSDKQDDLIGPQDELENVETPSPEESDDFDWLDDLDGEALSVNDEAAVPIDDLGDDLDWMNVDDDAQAEDLNLDALLGLEPDAALPETAEPVETEAEPASSELVEDESLDWLDALAADDVEPVDEMPTWQWPEDGDTDAALAVEATPEMEDSAAPPAADLEDIFSEEPAEADVVEDLDDAMSWLDDLAAEPDMPVEELPSVAEDMDLDALFALDSDLEHHDDLSSESMQSESLDEIFAVDSQNDSWLAGLADADEEPLPDFLEEDAEPAAASSLAEPIAAQDDDMAAPPEDVDDAMAWLEQLAARQGAPLDELPSVADKAEDEGVDAAELMAGAAAVGALGAVVHDDDEAEADTEPETAVADTPLAEADLLALDVPEDPDEAMAWLEKLAARQGAPLDELPSVSADEEAAAAPAAAEEPGPSLDAETAGTDDLLHDTDIEDDALGELDDAMAWLEGLEDDDEMSESAAITFATEAADEEADESLDFDFDFDEEAYDLFEIEETAASDKVATPDTALSAALSEELDWLEATVGVKEDVPAYNPEEISISDAELAAALEELTLLTVTGGTAGAVAAAAQDEKDAVETAVSAVETVDVLVEAAAAETEAISPDDIVESMPEDPDEAMAWLEKLAARQGAPLDELPSVAQDEYDDLAAATVALAAAETIPEEADSALEPTVAAQPEEKGGEELTTAVSPEDMDMDDAMAWLEQLAARQGTSLDELPTVVESDLEAEAVPPEWVAQQPTTPESTVPDLVEIPDISDETLDTTPDEDFFAALDEVPAIEGIETELTTVEFAENIDDSLPDWLADDEESKDDPLGHTGWLNSLDEPDMDSWLASEAEATMSSEMSIDALPEAVDTDSLVGGLADTSDLEESERKQETGELQMPDETPLFASELDEAQLLADLDLGDFGTGLDQAQLESARNALASGEIEAALDDYQSLVETGDSMHTVIADLERASELHQDKPMIRRMLGDAYMRNGQINRAIETYRNALDQM